MTRSPFTEEQHRLRAHYDGTTPWLTWGPYLSERQWGTVREDYSETGDAWSYFPHDHARSRAYRWGEDGIAGISDLRQNLCFALAMWNGKDPILKERLFGLTGPEGNHGEDVKELYYYLDNTPSHAYMKYLYKYPQAAFPYDELVAENRRRSKSEPEYELADTGIFDQKRYFDVFIEYAKAADEDLLIRITVANRGPETAEIHLLPTLWFRNLWSFGLMEEKPRIRRAAQTDTHHTVIASHPNLGNYFLSFAPPERYLFTENETNEGVCFGRPNPQPYTKDAFHRVLTGIEPHLLDACTEGSKFAPMYQLSPAPGKEATLRLRLSRKEEEMPLGAEFDACFHQRIEEADEFYARFVPTGGAPDLAAIQRQAFAGMLWTKQYYNIDIPRWLEGDPGQPPPPASRKKGRNHKWKYLNNADIISMPDKWEYPWYAVWDLAFHCVPLAMIDPDFAKHQLILMLREWYMAPSGQIPAYEWNFSDVNPPVHGWAALKVYHLDKQMTGKGDVIFLKRIFQKLMLNFTWWVNRKDTEGNNVFEGGFLGLDNIGVFDRSSEIPGGSILEQADGTSWMAMFALNLMEMALEIAKEDPSFEDVATKFFEHFVYIAEALNHLGDDGGSLWDETDGFYYDVLNLPDGSHQQVKVRSLVGLTALFAVANIPASLQAKVPDFMKRLRWFEHYRANMGLDCSLQSDAAGNLMLSLVSREKLERILSVMLAESEFLSPYGIRSTSRHHLEHPYTLDIFGESHHVRYEPAESTTRMFGGNSNWRGPVWMPMNYMLIESLMAYCRFYEGQCRVSFPTGSDNSLTLTEVANELSRRLIAIFQQGADGSRAVFGATHSFFNEDPHFRDWILFYEYFHGDNGKGLGASHQTGWTGLIAELINQAGWKRD